MSGFPITLVDSGGYPVTQVSEGAPIAYAVATGGYPVTLVESGGLPLFIAGAGSTTFSELEAAMAGSGNSAIVDFTEATTDNNYTAPDLLNSNDFVQATAGNEPVISETLGAVFPDATRRAGFAFTGGTLSVAIAFTRASGDNAKRIITDGTGTNTALFYNSTQLAGLNGTVTVNGVSVTSRQALFNALTADTEVTILVTNLNAAAWTSFFIGAAGISPVGSLRRIVVMRESEIGDIADAREKAVAWVQDTSSSSQGGGSGQTPTPTPTPSPDSITMFGTETVTFSGADSVQLDMNGEYMMVAPSGLTVESNTLDGVTGRHGAQVDPVFEGEHGFDDRLIAVKYNAAKRLTYPSATISPGSTIVFSKSRDTLAGGVAASSNRSPVCDYFVVHVIAAPVTNPHKRLAPEALLGSNPLRARGVSDEIDLDALLASLPNLPIPSGKIPLSTVIDKLDRPYPLSALTRNDTVGESYEATVPMGFLMAGDDTSGYSRFLHWTWTPAVFHLLDKTNTSLADRKTLLRNLIRHGRDYFWPQYNDIENVGNNGGGHFSSQVIPAMIMLWAMGESTILSNYGTPTQIVRDNVEQFFYHDAGTIAACAEHSDPNLPHVYRTRRLDAVTADSITFEWDRVNGDGTPNIRFPGLIIRKSGDPTTSYGVITQDTNANAVDDLVTLSAANTTGLAADDNIYFDIPWDLVVGQPDWAITGINRDGSGNFIPFPATDYFPQTGAYNNYSGSARPQYRDRQNEAFNTVAILAPIFGVESSPVFGPIVDNVIYANRADFPGPTFINIYEWDFIGATVDGTFVTMQGFYAAHMENLIGTTRFNAQVGFTNVDSEVLSVASA